MKYLYGFMIGTYVSAIVDRLEGVRSMDTIQYPIILLAIISISAILNHKLRK